MATEAPVPLEQEQVDGEFSGGVYNGIEELKNSLLLMPEFVQAAAKRVFEREYLGERIPPIEFKREGKQYRLYFSSRPTDSVEVISTSIQCSLTRDNDGISYQVDVKDRGAEGLNFKNGFAAVTERTPDGKHISFYGPDALREISRIFPELQ